MIKGISEAYRELNPAEVHLDTDVYDNAWKAPAIPERQYRRVVAGEMRRFRAGEDILPYRVALECLRKLPAMENPTLLDVGASSAYYSEVLRIGNFRCEYTALDYSANFQKLAQRLYPGVRFDVGDACALPYANGQFDIVLHGAVLMHLHDYHKAVCEAARVAGRYVIFHRTPFQEGKPTRFFEKEAYGIPCREAWFNPEELLDLFARCGLSVVHSIDLFKTDDGYGHRTYACEKGIPWYPV